MKILLIGFSKLKYMPYMHFYLEEILPGGHEVHILYWNRDGKEEARQEGVTYHEYRFCMDDDIPKGQKLGGFVGYRRFAMDMLRRETFDWVVVHHSMPMLLLGGYLARHYRERYIFDYRDYTYERFGPFRRAMHRAVKASKVTFVSSDGFRFALPQSPKIHTSHNLTLMGQEQRARHWRQKGVLRIGFWGYIRHEQLNRRLIRALGGDERFELHYYGREQAIGRSLKAYAQELGTDNVFFHGEYAPRERYAFAAQTDILHNVYSNTEAPSQQYAMTNKYYDGLWFGLPQLCMVGSYMGQLVEQQGLGFALDPAEEGFADKVWERYHDMDADAFFCRCDRVLLEVTRGYEEGRRVIQDAIGSIDKIE